MKKKTDISPHLTEPDFQNRHIILFLAIVMGVDNQNLTYCSPKCAVLHPIHYRTYAGSELCVKSHTNKTHLVRAGYYLLIVF